jgi:ubiquinone/menaquinone biosynthesis methyltransferase
MPEPNTSTMPEPLAASVDVRGMFDRIADRYDAANRVMSVGVDVMWRRKALGPLLDGVRASAGDRVPVVLDLGAGTLDGALAIAAREPRARVVAADFATNMLRAGRRKLGGAAARIDTNGADGHRLPFRDASFDGAFSAFCVRNFARLPVALAELRRVVRPRGTIAILEFFRPARTRVFFDRFYNARVLPLLGWAVTGDRAAYQYLPESIAKFLSREEFEAALRTAGFAETQGRDLFPAGVASLVVAR